MAAHPQLGQSIRWLDGCIIVNFMIRNPRYITLRRILENAGGTYAPEDSETILLEKYLTIIGGTPVPGDNFDVLLRKVVTKKGRIPDPGDNEGDLLTKWLDAEGGERDPRTRNLWLKLGS